jgi:hypothetical protein
VAVTGDKFIHKPLFWRVVVEGFWDRLWHDAKKAIFRVEKWEPKKSVHGGKDYDRPQIEFAKMTEEGARRFLLSMAVAPCLLPNTTLESFAEKYGLDMKAIRKKVEAELDEKKTKQPVKKPTGKPVKRKK